LDCTYQLVYGELENFSSGAICLVLASDVFMEEDYIRDFDEFMDSKNETAFTWFPI
jgi:hypothetical protein